MIEKIGFYLGLLGSIASIIGLWLYLKDGKLLKEQKKIIIILIISVAVLILCLISSGTSVIGISGNDNDNNIINIK